MIAFDIASPAGMILSATAFLAALLSTSVGAGGGLLLVVLASFLPATAVIPVHAGVMLIGSGYSWSILKPWADHALLKPFVVGSVIGLALAVPFIGYVSDEVLSLLLASFLLISAWVPFPRSLAGSRHYPWNCGVISTFLSVFVGATRPILVTMFSKSIDDQKTVVATVNACATLQHIGKIILFAATGVLFLEHFSVIAVLIIATILGSWCGKYILISANQQWLKYALKLLVSLLALQILSNSMDWEIGKLFMQFLQEVPGRPELIDI